MATDGVSCLFSRIEESSYVKYDTPVSEHFGSLHSMAFMHADLFGGQLGDT